MTSLTLRSPADILAAVPYLLGFHPTNSVVLLGLRGKRVIFQARTDAPVPAETGELASYLAAVAVRQAPTAAILIGYGSQPTIVNALTALRAALEADGVPVAEVLRVHDGRFWAFGCGDPGCGPAEGIPFDAAGTEVAATATYGGMVALPDRAALAGSLVSEAGPGIEPELARARERLAEVLVGGARQRRAAARVAVREALDRYAVHGRLDDDEVAWLAVLLEDVRARDDAWRRMLTLHPCPEHGTMWRDVVRRVPDRYVPAPATLLALTAWRTGDGVLASIAAERALAADPAYALADLLLQALHAAIPPSAIEILPDPAPDPGPRRRRAARVTAA